MLLWKQAPQPADASLGRSDLMGIMDAMSESVGPDDPLDQSLSV